ncbi:MAG: alpha/beta hydrolase [Bacillota bacterium]
MSDLNYHKLLNTALDYYFKGEYKKGYEYIDNNQNKVNGNQAQVYNFKYTLACKAGLIDTAMDIMKEAVIQKGYWYSKEYLLEDEDLDPLRVRKEFKQIVDICSKRETKAKNNSKPKLKIFKSEDSIKAGQKRLLMVLHGNQENIDITYKYWKNIPIKNNLLALPQSSMIEFSEAYSWDDIKKGTIEIKDHLDYIISKYQISENDIILGGFSAGARIILEAVGNNHINPRGLILMAPWIPDMAEKRNIISRLKKNNIKVFLLVGDKDKDCFELSKQFIELLEQGEIPFSSKIINNLNHEYPSDFNEELKNAVEYFWKD